MPHRIIVIGGGAAGLLAAGRAAALGADVLLLEKTDRPGRKLRITGKGRGNLTNTAPRLDLPGRAGLHLRPNAVEERNHNRRWNDAGKCAKSLIVPTLALSPLTARFLAWFSTSPKPARVTRYFR